MKRNLELDVVRCGMNYMVVMLHAWAAFQYVDRTTIEFKSWTFVLSHLCWMAIPSFFLISGYLFFSRFSLASWPDKMWRRVKRLAVPYLAWNISFVVFYLAMARLVPRLATRVATFGLDTWCGALSKIASLTEAPIDGPLWFLRTLIFLSIASPLLWVVMRVWKGWLAIGLAALWVAVEQVLGLSGVLGMVIPAYAILCFVVGGVIMLNGRDLAATFRNVAWLWGGLVVCVARALPIFVNWHLPGIVPSLLIFFEAPALIALVSRFPVERICTNAIYRYFKDMSFFAYAGHFLFCSMFLHTLAPLVAGMTTGKMTVLVLIFFCLGVPAMALVYGLGRRFAPKVLRLYDGTL